MTKRIGSLRECVPEFDCLTEVCMRKGLGTFLQPWATDYSTKTHPSVRPRRHLL